MLCWQVLHLLSKAVIKKYVDCSSSHTVPCCGPSFRPLPSLTCTSPSYSETDRLYLEYNAIWQCVNNISALCCSKLYYFCLPTYFLNKTTYLLFRAWTSAIRLLVVHLKVRLIVVLLKVQLIFFVLLDDLGNLKHFEP